MKILHTSHSGLPDARIEKTALTMKKEGNEVIFLGGRPSSNQTNSIFEEIHYIPIVNNLQFVLDSRFRKKWIRKIDEIKPDVVHAHNINAASMMLGTEFPVVYDDHEYWSQQIFRFKERGILRKLALRPFINKIPEWEHEILERYPVLTVCENIAREHRKIAQHVGVTKNYPLLAEAEDLKNQETRTGNVYVGGDFNLPKFLPHRNMSGLKDVLDFEIITGMEHSAMMNRLTHFNIGLTPWRSHPFHQYCEPNKHYEYLVAGLQVILTSSLAHPFHNEPYVHSFKTYEEIPALIDSLEMVDGQKIMNHSVERYIWEKQEQIIRDIYKTI